MHGRNSCKLAIKIGNKKRFLGDKTFMDCLLVLAQVATCPSFAEKIFANSHKTSKFAKVFSLESFLLYGISHGDRYLHLSFTTEPLLAMCILLCTP